MLSFESTWKEIEDAKSEGAVIGIGAIEQHGIHLPLNVDCMSADYLARGIAKEFGWYLLPTMPYGCSSEHMGFPGTMTMRSATLIAFFNDIADSLRYHGISKLVIVSGHGGNWFLKMMSREMNFQRKDMKVIVINTDRWFYPVLQQLTKDASLHHAGEHETAIAEFLHPELVKSPIPDDDNPDYGFDMLDLVQSRRLAAGGHWGFPSKSTPEKGRILLERGLESAVEYLRSRLQLIDKLHLDNDSKND